MPTDVNRQIVLRRRPTGAPKPSDFELVQTPLPKPGAGEVLCRTRYLSLDPYMRGRMDAGISYTGGTNPDLGQVMVGGTVSEVVASDDPAFRPGDVVLGFNGWQEYATARPKTLRKLDPTQAPISTALGVLGMPGMTAYVGLLDIGKPRAGETVVVSAAAGAVGSVVGQIAKIKGCRAVGVAGSAAKCRWVVDELGFDACVDHRGPDFPSALAAACPDGIDVYFENVGGAVLEAVLRRINMNARIPLCGLIAQYNATGPVAGPDLRTFLVNRVLLRGFIVSDHLDRQADFLADCTGWLREGRLKYREDIAEGLENAPAAFIGLLEGRNFGKQLVRVG
jgi:NADPH-dependent curcumin reductase CurA